MQHAFLFRDGTLNWAVYAKLQMPRKRMQRVTQPTIAWLITYCDAGVFWTSKCASKVIVTICITYSTINRRSSSSSSWGRRNSSSSEPSANLTMWIQHIRAETLLISQSIKAAKWMYTSNVDMISYSQHMNRLFYGYFYTNQWISFVIIDYVCHCYLWLGDYCIAGIQRYLGTGYNQLYL